MLGMLQRLPKKYRVQYERPRSVAGQVLFFAFKIIGPVALFFIAAIGMDVYALFG
jgi:hypothetical protein